MTDITIPPEALKAFLREVAAHNENLSGEAASAACLAMLRAWPGVDTRPNIYGRQDAILILPLTENADV